MIPAVASFSGAATGGANHLAPRHSDQEIPHAAKTRPLTAGTIVGSGTIANEDTGKGASCLAEQRTVETLRDGKPSTPFPKYGDVIRIDVTDRDNVSIFGAIEQLIASPSH